MEPTLQAGPSVGNDHRMALRLLGLLVGVVIAFALILWATTTPGGPLGAWSALTLPEELRSAMVVTNMRQSQSAAYVPQGLWYRETSRGVGRITALAKEDHATLAVRTVPGTYALAEGGRMRISDRTVIDAPSAAPSGRMIVYARIVEEEPDTHGPSSPGAIPSQVVSVNPAHSEVRLLQTGAVESTGVVSGYAPLFIDDTQFLFFTSSGAYRYDLANGTAHQLLERSLPYFFGPVLQSPDRTLVALVDPIAGATRVYRVGETELSLVTEVKHIMLSPALSDTALYDVKGTPGGAEVWRYGLDGSGPTLIHTFPSGLAVSRLIF